MPSNWPPIRHTAPRALGIAIAVTAIGGMAGAAHATSRIAGGLASAPLAGSLADVAASSARSAWAVGDTGPERNGLRPLIEHWNGTTWRRVPAPVPRGGGTLLDVAVTPTDTPTGRAWAVGAAGQKQTRTLVEHWNGRTWSRVPSPTPPAGGTLVGVAAIGAREAWAVGSTYQGSGTTLIEHWNGRSWSRVPSPSPRPAAFLYSVVAISSTNAWAIGLVGADAFTGRVLIEHWNGRAWSVTPSPRLPHGWLTSVTASGAHGAWAVGTVNVGSRSLARFATLVLHWNGTAWTRTPSPCTRNCVLTGVTAVSAGTTWAVGYKDSRALILHWTGTAWVAVPAPRAPGGRQELLRGVSVPLHGAGFAVGRSGSFSHPATLILRWTGTRWRI